MRAEHRARREIWIVSGPLSMKALVLWAVVIFVAGFFDGRQIERISESASTSSAVSATPPSTTPTASNSVATAPATSTSTSNPTTPARVGIKLLKFSPEKIEVKSGDTVQWVNADLTPHNVTSVGRQEINSGTIDANASWNHTFSQPGTFSYYCSFHPEMKGIVVVR